jgi:hypothetical protein
VPRANMNGQMCLEAHDPTVKTKEMTWISVVVEKQKLMTFIGFHLYSLLYRFHDPKAPSKREFFLKLFLELHT